MNKGNHITKKKLYKSELMKRIIEIRYTDVEEERDLCKQLLDIAEPLSDTYGCAFANVYLFDSSLALEDYSNCDFYLIRAKLLCDEHEYEDLKMVLCNCAGLYYLRLNDEQTAIEYYIDGLKSARHLGEYDMESKLLNNIGIGFAGRDDWESAKEYFFQAVSVTTPHAQDKNNNNVISYLCNLAAACQNLGDMAGSEKYLCLCESLRTVSLYHKLRLACGRVSHYARLGDRKNCFAMDDMVMELGLATYDSKMFVCDMCIGNCEDMLKFDERERAEKYLEILAENYKEAAIVIKYRIECLRISYYEKYKILDKLKDAYKDYYYLTDKMGEMDDIARSQSMLSKIQLTSVTIQRETIRKKNQELETAGELDDLTGLYNRRYFNKLVTKYASHRESVSSLGFIMLDVDYFKEYNDFYGHFTGDDALKAVANILKQWAANGFYVSRYGGDEFVCLCVNVSDEQILQYLCNVERELAAKKITHGMSEVCEYVTLSIGYCNETEEICIDELIKTADQALYESKRNGRNRHACKHVDKKAQ